MLSYIRRFFPTTIHSTSGVYFRKLLSLKWFFDYMTDSWLKMKLSVQFQVLKLLCFFFNLCWRNNEVVTILVYLTLKEWLLKQFQNVLYVLKLKSQFNICHLCPFTRSCITRKNTNEWASKCFAITIHTPDGKKRNDVYHFVNPNSPNWAAQLRTTMICYQCYKMSNQIKITLKPL